MRQSSIAWTIIAGFLLASVPPVPSAAHVGSTNPISEGWTLVAGDAGVSGRSVNNIGGQPDPEFPATRSWEINELGAETLRYEQPGPGPTDWWVLEAHLRVVDLADPVDAGIQIALSNGSSRFALEFGSDAQGGTLIHRVGAGVPVTIPPLSAPGVHTDYVTVHLVYSDVDGSADLFVNGLEVASDWVGVPTSPGSRRQLEFGDGSTEPGGRARFARVLRSTYPTRGCRNGIDDDGDGLVDFAGGDPDCSQASDPSESEPCVDPGDADGDFVCDPFDNCLSIANGPNGLSNQIDANLDGYGNRCDADYNDDGAANGLDFGPFISSFGTLNSIIDLDGDGVLTGGDFWPFISLFNTVPGPSGLACAGTIPCGP